MTADQPPKEPRGFRRVVGRRWWQPIIVFAVVSAGIAVGVGWFESSGDDPGPASPVTTPAVTLAADRGGATALNLSAGGLVMSAAPCPEVDPALIARAPIAFMGTVTLHSEGYVELTVDKDYVGVGAEAVTLTASRGVDFWLGPVPWDVGSQYLVTAHSGVVSFCGQSGSATPELRAIFDEAFPS